ncbi:MAG: 30S ribosomal protein S6 [Pseudomonadota bacterium]
MRRYESIWVVDGDLPDEDVKAAIDKFTRIIAAQGGTLVDVDEWGRKKLAYKIKSASRGYYVLADFAGTPETVKELERNYRIDDRIIRYLTVKKSDSVNLEALQAEIAAKAKKAASSAAAAAASAAAASATAVSAAAAAVAAPPPEEAAPAPAAPEAPVEAAPVAEVATQAQEEE